MKKQKKEKGKKVKQVRTKTGVFAKTQLYFDQEKFKTVLPEYTPAQVANEQAKCTNFGPMFTFLKTGELPPDDKKARQLLLTQDSYVMLDGILYHVYDRRSTKIAKQSDIPCLTICIPEVFVDKVLSAVHSLGHYSGRQNYLICRSEVYFSRMFTRCVAWSKACPNCQLMTHNIPPRAPLGHRERPTSIFEEIVIDVLGPYPASRPPIGGALCSFCLVAVCALSSYTFTFPVPDCRSETLARVLFEGLILRIGAPIRIVSDQAAYFRSELMQKTLKHCGIEMRFSSPVHSQSHGLVERHQKDLIASIARYLKQNHSNWSDVLQSSTFSHNVKINRNLGYSAFFLVHGRLPRLPWAMSLPTAHNEYNAPPIPEILENLRESRRLALQNSEDASKKAKMYYDTKHKATLPGYAPSDLVLLWSQFPSSAGQVARKFVKNWSGPWQILEVSPDGAHFSLKSAFDNTVLGHPKPTMFHCDRLKPFLQFDPLPPEPSNVTPATLKADDVSKSQRETVDLIIKRGGTQTLKEDEIQRSQPRPPVLSIPRLLDQFPLSTLPIPLIQPVPEPAIAPDQTRHTPPTPPPLMPPIPPPTPVSAESPLTMPRPTHRYHLRSNRQPPRRFRDL